MQIAPEHRLLQEMDELDDEWMSLQTQSSQVNALARTLFQRLTECMTLADELDRLQAPLEKRFIRVVTSGLNQLWHKAKALVTVTGGFPKAP